jgi:hypothetical protein
MTLAVGTFVSVIRAAMSSNLKTGTTKSGQREPLLTPEKHEEKDFDKRTYHGAATVSALVVWERRWSLSA